MSAPPKDNTSTFIYGVNHDKYNGENIISGSSCTTNCLAPLLKILDDEYTINNAVFTTIHSSTASQNIVDSSNKKARTSRGTFGNIIPHTTGASSSINQVLPQLSGKIKGTSLRVPISSSSIVDVNVEFKSTLNKNITISDIIELIKNNKYYDKVYSISDKKLVSCDFLTTTTPTILDTNASMDLGNNKFKFMIWYDNEWSYSTQLIRIVESMYKFNNNIVNIDLDKNKYFIDNFKSNFLNKRVVLRLDLNVSLDKNMEIIDDYRISSSIQTIKEILKHNPKYLILTSHFSRPKEYDKKYSLINVIKRIEHYLEQNIEFLHNGICNETFVQILNSNSKIFLLENLRFNKEETNYNDYKDMYNETINSYKNMGDIFICDAFGCVHRKHMSIYGIKNFNKQIGYGYLINNELENLNKLISSIQDNKKLLCIIGGNKVSDKLPIVELFSNIKNATIFVAGGLAKHCIKENLSFENVIVMKDGWGNKTLEDTPEYIEDISSTDLNAYDIGNQSKSELFDLILQSDIVFWNGSLGVIEHEFYRKSSIQLVKLLESTNKVKTIMGGGETASLIENKNSNIYVSTGGGAMLEYLQNKICENKNICGLDIYE